MALGYFIITLFNGPIPVSVAPVLIMVVFYVLPQKQGYFVAAFMVLTPMIVFFLYPSDITPVFARGMVTSLGVAIVFTYVINRLRNVSSAKT